MDVDIELEHAAIHFVDPNESGPRCADKELNLIAAPPEVRDYLVSHIAHLWDAPEGTRTRAGIFADQSVFKSWHNDLTEDDGRFFAYSQAMARRLHEVSPTTASPGLLTIVLLRQLTGGQRRFLALFKMDPRRDFKIRLSGAGKLDLAVTDIPDALPDPGEDRMLKCAILRHPTRLTYDVKLRDDQNTEDPANYFMTFLGCAARWNEKTQLREMFKTMEQYAKEHHPESAWQQEVPKVVDRLARRREPVTAETAVQVIRETNVFPDFDAGEFMRELQQSKAADIHIAPETVDRTRMRLRLLSGITISGPVDVMHEYVKAVPVEGGIEFQIRSAEDFDVVYE